MPPTLHIIILALIKIIFWAIINSMEELFFFFK